MRPGQVGESIRKHQLDLMAGSLHSLDTSVSAWLGSSVVCELGHASRDVETVPVIERESGTWTAAGSADNKQIMERKKQRIAWFNLRSNEK